MNPRSWHNAMLAGSFGIFIGLGAFTFYYAKGYSYLTNDPRACANCHVMQSHFDAWVKSSHRSVAACNDCHTPKNLFGKYYVKSRNGFWHSYYFTVGGFHEPILIKPGNRRVTEQRCRDCHADITQAIDPFHGAGKTLDCLRCHANVGHWNPQ